MSLCYSQDGTGGVGTTDGTSSLVLWLDASTLSRTDGSLISSWTDNSGYGHDFSLRNGAIFSDPSVNNYPSLSFNGSSHYFERPNTAALSPPAFSVFSSTQVLSNVLFKTVISNRDDPPGAVTAGFILYSVPQIPIMLGSFGLDDQMVIGR